MGFILHAQSAANGSPHEPFFARLAAVDWVKRSRRLRCRKIAPNRVANAARLVGMKIGRPDVEPLTKIVGGESGSASTNRRRFRSISEIATTALAVPAFHGTYGNPQR